MNNLTYEQTMLYIMYNDNVRQISHLTETNDTIRNSILNGLNNSSENNRGRNHRNRNRYNRNNHNRNNHNRNTNNNSNNNANQYTSNYNQYTPSYYTNSYYTPNYYVPNYYTPHYYLPNYYGNNYYSTQRLQPRRYPSTILYRQTYPLLSNPSRRQINEATEQNIYGDLISPIHTICPISHEQFNENSQVTTIRHCGHIFNTSELNRWFENHSDCPVCRYDIRNYRNAVSSSSRTSRTSRNYYSYDASNNQPLDASSNNMYDSNNLANEILNILNSALTLDFSYNNLVMDVSYNSNDNILSYFMLTRPSRY